MTLLDGGESTPMHDIVSYLCETEDFEALILFGSQADGRATSRSDYDFIALKREGGYHFKESEIFGKKVACYFYNCALLNTDCTSSHLRIAYRAQPVYDPCGLGTQLVAKVTESVESQLKPLSDDARAALYVNIAYVYPQTLGDDPLAWLNRRSFLTLSLYASLLLNDCPYLGSKKSLALLKRDAPDAYRLFSSALAQNSNKYKVEEWFEYLSRARFSLDFRSLDFSCGGESQNCDSFGLENLNEPLRNYAHEFQQRQQSQSHDSLTFSEALSQAVAHLKSAYEVKGILLCSSYDDNEKPSEGSAIHLFCFLGKESPTSLFPEIKAYGTFNPKLNGLNNNFTFGGWHTIIECATEASLSSRVALTSEFAYLHSSLILYQSEQGLMEDYQKALNERLRSLDAFSLKKRQDIFYLFEKPYRQIMGAEEGVSLHYAMSEALVSIFATYARLCLIDPFDKKAILDHLQTYNAESYQLFCKALNPRANKNDAINLLEFIKSQGLVCNINQEPSR